jgi:catechol 2,3-dioxygenase-like lactoylglutathione lyase family enzyme
MRIQLASVFVDDQEKAAGFYTEVLGFEKKEDVPLGEHRWLTVVSPDDPDGTQLLLEPERLSALGVRFTQPPAVFGPVITAVFEDTCGNLIQIAQRK